uniref:Uncharacterized protein n=1 Tax=Rhizophora mucronata TaxID=61149 RepID=A0A2P2QJH3_RHIMU
MSFKMTIQIWHPWVMCNIKDILVV